jgi:hypothetical protein
MPSVEYSPTALVYTEQTEERTDPDTGETQTVATQTEYRPFEVRLSKWQKESDGYHVNGFGTVTDFGSKLATQKEPFEWLTSNYQTTSGVTSEVVNQWVAGIDAVRYEKLDTILDYGNVAPKRSEVQDSDAGRLDFDIVLSGPTTWGIEWLTVSFDPSA